MSLNEKLTGLADEVRDVSSLNQRLSIEDMTREVSQMSSLNNFFLTKLPVMNDGKGHVSTTNPNGSQSFIGQGGFTGELVHTNDTNPTVVLKKGDTLVQAFTMKTDTFKNLNFNFQGSQTGDHVCLAHAYAIADNTYRIWATYMSPNEETYKLLNFWAKADSAGDKLHTELCGGGGSADIALTTDWKRYSTTGTSSNKEVLFFWSVSGSPVYIRWPELIADE